ncbi:MAG: HAD-IA family hydrolase [Alphaproteobacteria bacterium]|nr:HAD-IA family hydrolase [Alphaproteobacteria bacterium]
MKPNTVIFDLGGVLIDWNPRYLYRKILKDEAEIDRFLSDVCTHDWNVAQDAGRTIAEAVAEATARHPDKADLIHAFYERFEEMLGGSIAGTVAILEELHSKGTPLYALTNWSAETFPIGRRRFDFLSLFRHITVSGELKLAKPDPAIYRHALAAANRAAKECVFIDDSPKNVAAARDIGIHALHFTSPDALRGALSELGIL